MLTTEQLQAIRERVNKATPGPWVRDKSWNVRNESGYVIDWNDPDLVTVSDIYFIAHAREDVPALLDEIEQQKQAYQRSEDDAYKWFHKLLAAEREIERLRGALEFYANPYNNWSSEYDEPSYSIVDKDNGEIARQALEGK